MKRTRRQALGQHFLHSSGILEKIVARIDPQPDELIVEIGPGQGVLTFLLAERAGRVIAVEKDRRFLPRLEAGGYSNLTVIAADVLQVDFKELLAAYTDFASPVKLVGNLPYSISLPLLFKVLEERENFSLCVFLLQREVAERVCASPGSRKYAPLSILLQVHFQAERPFLVPPGAFVPPPKVDSALVTLKRREHLLLSLVDENSFAEFLRLSFKERRKTLRNNLVRAGLPERSVNGALDHHGLDNRIRPEQVSINAFGALYAELKDSLPPTASD